MITPLKIDHTCLQVSDLEKTQSYLESIFDFKFFKHPNSNNSLAVESKNVHFFLEENDLPASYLAKQHISFEIEDIEAIKKKLEAEGIKYESGTFTAFKYKNYHWIEWHDHDGIRLECIQII